MRTPGWARLQRYSHYYCQMMETRVPNLLKRVLSEVGKQRQDIKVGDVVKLTSVEELIVGGDGLVWAANIRTSNGKTNRPIVKLFPLEVSSSDENTSLSSDDKLTPVTQSDHNAVTDPRPTLALARKAMGKFAVWADTLVAPASPEDVGNWIWEFIHFVLHCTLYFRLDFTILLFVVLSHVCTI